jgi:(3,5-dihydroxyphenyl)acetyl-CoA 1,2-dioxygenase
MTNPAADPGLLERAGLPADASRLWHASRPDLAGTFGRAADSVAGYLTAGRQLALRLPARPRRSAAEQAAYEHIAAASDQVRESFLCRHAAALYDEVTASRAKYLRLEDLLPAVAARVPGLVPDEAELRAERERRLPDKEGIELAHGLLAGHVLAAPVHGRHLIEAMLRPLPQAAERLAEFQAADRVDFGPVLLTRQGKAAVLELRNPRHLNAEDDVTLGPTECAVDVVILDPRIEVGVIRGGIVDHPKYPATRVFGSGLNLTRLYLGRIDYLFFLVRDLSFVHKVYRGVTMPAGHGSPGPEKLWIAAVERFAVGGACQLLHVVDHVVATRGARLFLPARNEGIIPGASNLRLPRFVGDRPARQAILSGRQWIAGEPDAELLCDQVVEQTAIDDAVRARVELLTSSGLVNAIANRRALRAGQEPVDAFREYMATFAIEQARCHLSPALVRNLEVHWRAGERTS